MELTNTLHNLTPKTALIIQKTHIEYPKIKRNQAQKNKPPETSTLAKETTKNM